MSESIIHIGDLHFWKIILNPMRMLNKRFLGNLTVMLRRSREFQMERAQEFIQYLTTLGCSSVLLTGDFTSTSVDEEFSAAAYFVDQLRQKGFKIYLVPGNHDVYTFEAARKKRFEHYFGDFLPSGGYPAMECLADGTPLFLCYTVRPRHLSARGHVSLETIFYLEEHIQELPSDKPILIAGHYPFLDFTYNYESSQFRTMTNAKDLREMLGMCQKPILYIAGHVHRFSYVQDSSFSTLFQLTTGAFFRTVYKENTFGEFSEIVIEPTGFSIYHHVLHNEWMRNKIKPCSSL